MEPKRFDAVSKFFASRRLSRRQALSQGGAGLATGALAVPGLAAATAQDATPQPAGAPKPEYLFVQSFQGGSVALKEGEEGRYTVTLEHGLGQTIYFSDRPNRLVGTIPTGRFLDTLGFPEDNPPNAALVVENASGETDIAVVELFAPVLDPAGPTVTYDVRVLAEWERVADLTLDEAPADLAALGTEFGTAHLFIDGIDDCGDATMDCRRLESGVSFGQIDNAEHDGYCYSWAEYDCLPCAPRLTSRDQAAAHWASICNQRFPTCGNNCYADPIRTS